MTRPFAKTKEVARWGDSCTKACDQHEQRRGRFAQRSAWAVSVSSGKPSAGSPAVLAENAAKSSSACVASGWLARFKHLKRAARDGAGRRGGGGAGPGAAARGGGAGAGN